MAAMFIDATAKHIEALDPNGDVALKFVATDDVVVIGNARWHWELAIVALRPKVKHLEESRSLSVVRHLVALHHVIAAGKFHRDGRLTFSTDDVYAELGLVPTPAQCDRIKQSVRNALLHVPPTVTWPAYPIPAPTTA